MLQTIASSRQTLLSLQAGRGLAAVSVVFYHTEVVFALPKYWGSYPFGTVFQPANSGVFYFFVLSGFIIAFAHSRDVGDPSRLLRYAANRTRRIYPMYWIVTAVTLAIVYLGHLGTPFGGLAFYAGDASLLPFDGDHGTLAVAWTLFHEILFYAAFSLLLVSRRIGIAVLSAWAAGCVANMLFLHGLPPDTGATFAGVVFAPINLLFFFGMAAFVVVHTRRVPFPIAFLCAGIAIYSGVWIYEVIRPQAWDGLIPILLFGAGAALVVLALCDFEKRGVLKIPRAFVVLGDASYSIYLTHFLAISAIAKVLSSRRGVLPEQLAFCVIVALSVATGLAAYYCVERPLLRAGRHAA